MCEEDDSCDHRESTVHYRGPRLYSVQSHLCGWSYLIKFLIGNLNLSYSPIANLAVQSFCSMYCTQCMPATRLNTIHSPGPLHFTSSMAVTVLWPYTVSIEEVSRKKPRQTVVIVLRGKIAAHMASFRLCSRQVYKRRAGSNMRGDICILHFLL